MAPEAASGERAADIDRALQAWRQGDCTLESQWFVHKIDPRNPLTPAGSTAAGQGAELAEQQVVAPGSSLPDLRHCQSLSGTALSGSLPARAREP